MMATTDEESVKRSLSHYFANLRKMTTKIQGRDIKKFNIPPGPVYKKLLKKVLDAKLDGYVISKEDELNYLKQFIWFDMGKNILYLQNCSKCTLNI